MLQQTQVSRVLAMYPVFLKRFPTLKSLARAKQRDVVLAWQGMGYNNRAVRLHKLAQTVLHEHDGKIPDSFEALTQLSGVGRYTANAMLYAAFEKRVAIVDVNVQRVLSRIFWRMPRTNSSRESDEIWKLAETLVPGRNVYDWNQALMDLGATVCKARAPECNRCPVAKQCASRTGMKGHAINTRKREASFNGIPNRLYRGKIIQRLSKHDGARSVRADVLGKWLHPKFTKGNENWFNELLEGLRKDGLIRVRGNGTLQTRHISLA